MVLLMKGSCGFEREELIEVSDIESDISSMRNEVHYVVASRFVVHALSVVPTVSDIASPVCSTPIPLVDVDRVARTKYMQDWRERTK